MNTCGQCAAFPPNLYDEAYCDFNTYYCRAIGQMVKGDTSACGMFAKDKPERGDLCHED